MYDVIVYDRNLMWPLVAQLREKTFQLARNFENRNYLLPLQHHILHSKNLSLSLYFLSFLNYYAIDNQ